MTLRRATFALIGLAAAALSGCMATPRNGDVVENRASTITFSSFVSEHRGTLSFQAASSFSTLGAPTSWETVASADVARDGIAAGPDSDGITWWYVSRPVTLQNRHWNFVLPLVPGVKWRAMMRTMYEFAPGATPFTLQTFQAGPETQSCIDTHRANGASGGDIMNDCSRMVPSDVVTVLAKVD